MNDRTCVIPGCDQDAYSRYLCSRHYHRARERGIHEHWPLMGPPEFSGQVPDQYHPAPRDRTCLFCGAPYSTVVGDSARVPDGLCSLVCVIAMRDGAPVNVLGREAVPA